MPSKPPSPDAEAVRALLVRKALADCRQRAAAAVLLGVTETDVLAVQHLGLAGTLTPGQLAGRLQLTTGGTSALIQRLMRLGYVTREPHPDDRRSSMLRLSPAGQSRAAGVYAPLVGALDAVIGELGVEARDAIGAFLARIAAAGEAHAEELVRSVERDRPQVQRVPVPGLWS